MDGILKKRLAGEGVTEEELWQYKTALLLFFGRGYAKRGWAMQMHFAAQRNNNSRMYRLLGPDTGYDSIGTGGAPAGSGRLPERAGRERRTAADHPLLPGPGDNAAL